MKKANLSHDGAIKPPAGWRVVFDERQNSSQVGKKPIEVGIAWFLLGRLSSGVEVNGCAGSGFVSMND